MLLFSSGAGTVPVTGYLDAAELADIRADFMAFMPDQINVLRNILDTDGVDGSDGASGSDGFGGQVQSWTVVSTYTGRLVFSGGKGSEVVQGGQTHAVINPICLLPWNANVRATDRIQVAGHIYEVTDSTVDKSELFQLTVYLHRLTPTAN